MTQGSCLPTLGCRTSVLSNPKHQNSISRSRLRNVIVRSATYSEGSDSCFSGAPEDYQGHQEDIEASKPVPAAADIWSLGAVLSEVAVWITCGLPSLYKYRRQRLKGTGAVPQVPAAFYDDFGDVRLYTYVLFHSY